jgi:predicted transcriptional regulator
VITCLVEDCRQEFYQITWKHLEKAHGLTIHEYRELFPGAPLLSESHMQIFTESKGGFCLICGFEYKKIGKHLDRHDISFEAYCEKFELGRKLDDPITCNVCGEEYDTIGTHIRSHGLTTQDYSQMFPGAPISSKPYLEHCRIRQLGVHQSEESRKLIGDGNRGLKRTLTQRFAISLRAKQHFLEHPEFNEEFQNSRIEWFAVPENFEAWCLKLLDSWTPSRRLRHGLIMSEFQSYPENRILNSEKNKARWVDNPELVKYYADLATEQLKDPVKLASFRKGHEEYWSDENRARFGKLISDLHSEGKMGCSQKKKTKPEILFCNIKPFGWDWIYTGCRLEDGSNKVDWDQRPKGLKLDYYNKATRVNVEIDGCWWHGCWDCYSLPFSGVYKEHYEASIIANIKTSNRHRQKGFLVVRVFQCQLESWSKQVLEDYIQESIKSELVLAGFETIEEFVAFWEANTQPLEVGS